MPSSRLPTQGMASLLMSAPPEAAWSPIHLQVSSTPSGPEIPGARSASSDRTESLRIRSRTLDKVLRCGVRVLMGSSRVAGLVARQMLPAVSRHIVRLRRMIGIAFFARSKLEPRLELA